MAAAEGREREGDGLIPITARGAREGSRASTPGFVPGCHTIPARSQALSGEALENRGKN